MAAGSAAPSRVGARSAGSLSDTRERGDTLRVRNTEPPKARDVDADGY
jgi:hypothetical protein